MKKIILGILAFILFAIFAAIIYIKTLLPNVGKPADITLGNSKEQIERGKYLANSVCACMDCHSTRDWSKFAGPVMPGTLGKGGEAFTQEFGFPGGFYSKNVTPFGLANWSDGEIVRAITCGVSKDGSALFPVMPYLNYGQLDTEDIKSIVAYLRTLSPVKNTIPKSEADFPMNLIINTIPQKSNPTKKPDQSDVLEYGKYLVNAAACAECHTQQEKGQKVKGMDFAGGFGFSLPNGIVRSSNITPHESGLLNYNKQSFINRFKIYADSSYVDPLVEANAFQTVMPWKMYSTMTEQDLGAIFEYLRTLTPIENKVTRFTPKGSI